MCEDEVLARHEAVLPTWLILGILVSFHMVIFFTTYKSRSYAYTLVISYIM